MKRATVDVIKLIGDGSMLDHLRETGGDQVKTNLHILDHCAYGAANLIQHFLHSAEKRKAPADFIKLRFSGVLPSRLSASTIA
jgi:hypothetical protein